MDAWLFWKSVTIGVAVAAPVGPMSLLCIHRTLDHGQPAGLRFGAGIAAADLTYAAIAAFGITAVSWLLLAATFWIKLIGSLLLIVLGVRIAVSRPAPDSRKSGSGLHAFATVYGLTLANPPTILFFAGIFASVASLATASQSVVFSAGVFAGSMLWWIILTTLVTKSAALMKRPVMASINRLSGLVLIGFAAHGLATLS
ncbi:MAG TPA: LysE family transporter [Aestuariivirgaceae bacterium]|nr:LysE family transporter [Aestuariivirgaceae bacterium]